MTAPAVIKVRLDTAGAKADLRTLYDEAGRGIRVPVSGVGRGGGGGGGAGGGAVGGGGFNLAPILGRLLSLAPLAMLGAPIAQDVGTLGMGLLGGLGAGVSGAFGLSSGAGAERGRQQAIQETAQMFGLARGLGLIDRKESDAFYETIKPFREAQGRGTAEISSELKFENAADMLASITKAIEAGFTNAAKSLNTRGAI